MSKTISEFIRNAIDAKKSDFMVRMSNVPYCDEEEEKELVELLNRLTDDDLKIVKKEIIKL